MRPFRSWSEARNCGHPFCASEAACTPSPSAPIASWDSSDPLPKRRILVTPSRESTVWFEVTTHGKFTTKTQKVASFLLPVSKKVKTIPFSALLQVLHPFLVVVLDVLLGRGHSLSGLIRELLRVFQRRLLFGWEPQHPSCFGHHHLLLWIFITIQ